MQSITRKKAEEELQEILCYLSDFDIREFPFFEDKDVLTEQDKAWYKWFFRIRTGDTYSFNGHRLFLVFERVNYDIEHHISFSTNSITSEGFLWAPHDANGRHIAGYNRLTEMQPGDIVLCYAETQIKSIGIVLESYKNAMSDVGHTGGKQMGYRVECYFYEFINPVQTRKYKKEKIAFGNGYKGAPFDRNGNGKEQGYLFYLHPILFWIFMIDAHKSRNI